SVEAVRIPVQFQAEQLADLDEWIAHQPQPRPSRPQAIRLLTQLGLQARAWPASPQPPARPARLAAPGLVWEVSNGRWVAIGEVQTRFVKRGHPATRVQLWAAIDADSEPTSTEWKSISDRCLKFQSAINTWPYKGTR